MPAGAVDDAWVEELKERFHAAHELEYGHRFDAAIEIINIRAVGIGRVDELQPATARGRRRRPVRSGDAGARGRVRGRRRGRAASHARSTSASGCAPATGSSGPAIVEQYDTTTVIPPGLEAEIDRHGNIVIDCTTRPRTECRARRRALDADPDARHRRRVRLDREGDGGRALPHVVLLDHPRVRGPRRRHLRPRREQPGRVGLDADVHGRDAEDREERDQDPRRRHPRGRRDPPQRPLRRRHALAGRRDRDPDLPRRRARRLLGRLGARARHRRRLPRPGDRPRRQLVGGKHLPGRQAAGARASGRRACGSTSSRTSARRASTTATSRR